MSNKNDWHERGELPPVGTVLEYSCLYRDGKESIELGQWYSGEIIAYHDGFVWTSDNGLRMISNTKFRPLRAERDVMVEDMLSHDCEPQEGMLSRRDFCAALIDAGWRPIKQQTEDDFLSYTLSETALLPDEGTAKKLYRAGCRFVEEGDE